MYRKFRGILLVSLCLVLVLGSVASSFAVGTGKIASFSSALTKAKPVNTKVQVTVQGTVKASLVQSSRLTLVAENNKLYNLTGRTAGLEKYIDKQVVIKGKIATNVISVGEKGILLEVINYKPVVAPSVRPSPVLPSPVLPTVAPSPEIISPLVKMEGVLKVTKSDEPIFSSEEAPYRFQLDTGAGLYSLQGNTAGLEKYDGLKIEVTGTVSPLKIYPPIFVVESYIVLNEPTPSPEYKVLQGVLKVTKSDEPIFSSEEAPYRFQLDTGAGLYSLQGNTEGLEKYDGYKVEVKGTVSMLMIYPPIFIVESYKIMTEPVPTPAYDVIKGTVKVIKADPASDIKVEEPYRYQLESETGLIELIGNTKGLEQYDGQLVEVKGRYVMTLLAQNPPMFNVVSYSPVLPSPTPVYSMTHSILSDKPLAFMGPKDGDFKVLDGRCVMSWSDYTDKAFFSAKITVQKGIQKYDYVFELASVKTSDRDSITGLFNIKLDGNTIVKEIPGKLYGLSQPAGSYFKFYSDSTEWHMSAYITNKLDF